MVQIARGEIRFFDVIATAKAAPFWRSANFAILGSAMWPNATVIVAKGWRHLGKVKKKLMLPLKLQG